MSETAFPVTPQAVTPCWLTRVLREAGCLTDARVTAVRAEPVGNGLLGESTRFRLQYDRPEPGAPSTAVGKFRASDPVPRGWSIGANLYLREVRFFQEVAPHISMRVPRVYAAHIDEATQDYVLLTEDQAPARAGDQIDGCSVDDCALAMREAAALHAANWLRPELRERPWQRGAEARAARQASVLPGQARDYLARFGDQLDAPLRTVVERFVGAYAPLMADRTAPDTLIHGDFRLDNVLFDVHDTPGTMATLDWQTLAVGCGLFDVAFFIGGSLDTDTRRANEDRLVREYHAALCAHGVRSYAFDACWRDYRRFAARALFTAVTAPLAVVATPRSDRMFMKMMRHHGAQVLDLGSLDFWT